MQSLLTFFLHLASKAWTVLVVAVLCGGTATVVYFSSAHAGSHSTPSSPATVVAAGHLGAPGRSAGLGHCAASVPVVPEANGGLVLIPVVAAMLAASSRRLWSSKAPAVSDDQQALGRS